MKNLNILIVEGNPQKENNHFLKEGIQTHTQSLKESINNFTKEINFDVVNPSSDKSLEKTFCWGYTDPRIFVFLKNRSPKKIFFY